MRGPIYAEVLDLRKAFLLFASHEIYFHFRFSKYFERKILVSVLYKNQHCIKHEILKIFLCDVSKSTITSEFS